MSRADRKLGTRRRHRRKLGTRRRRAERKRGGAGPNNDDINRYVDDSKNTRLHLAAKGCRPAEIAELLRNPAIDVNIGDSTNATPLSAAAEYRCAEGVKHLLAHPSIDVNALDKYGYTALAYTIKSGANDIIDMLLEHPDIRVTVGKSVYMAATFNELDILRRLLAHPTMKLRNNILADIDQYTPTVQAIFEERFPGIKRKAPISMLSKKRIHRTIRFVNDAGKVFYVNTMILPAGTVLFRGSASADTSPDMYGLKSAGKYHLYSNYNVFFYPYPFAADPIIAINYYHIYVLARDVEVVMAIEPSPNSRSDRHKDSYISSCSSELMKASVHVYQRDYDPCFNLRFIEEYPSIVGYIGLAKMDTDEHLENRKLKREYMTYFRNMGVEEYVNANAPSSFEGNAIGVPEVVLYPLSERSTDEMIIEDPLKEVYPEKYAHNYTLIETIDYTWNKAEFENILREYLSPDGHDGRHMTIDLATKMYVMWEEADDVIRGRCVSLEETDKLKWLRVNYDI